MTPVPLVTVLVPLYNCAHYVREAVDSILCQTWRDFELLIIDDGSTDEGPEIVASYEDERIVLLRNSANMGVAETLNRGLEITRSPLIARMDADDISLPVRLEQQVKFMEKHHDVGISGGWVRLFSGGQLPNVGRVPTKAEDVAAYMLFENSLWHVTAMMKKDDMIKAGLKYDPYFSRSEDYDLWTRAGEHFPLANTDRVLARVRRHQESVTRSNWDEMTRQTEIIQERLLRRIGLRPSPAEVSFHHRVGRGYRTKDKEDIHQAEKWLLRILTVNQKTGVYSQHSLAQVTGKVWFRLCANSGPMGYWVWRAWRISPLAAAATIPVSEKLRFLASIVWHKARRADNNSA